ncbi:uncharacterized protein LOC119689989 [Teleopsis dalmanni]|uniref:uncharacterized protein LOC119687633 n=1 Tax=Teleopsis dalmanni TaxID=139649 RepID=UPI000D3297EC|nr:uncharacterized protein LOC119687633 [Teleopsis dalmanni]XP_037960701.1 uncharacterized protein LOC119689852 [Teleopsis dalmanni]XP_037960885.1 uncharacterized protein LOC119689989 [Teleopsis dalmanni]
MMDNRRFTDGGDVDASHINVRRQPNYYYLPIVGGRFALFMYTDAVIKVQTALEEKIRLHHIRLRRQMQIPDDAFELLNDFREMDNPNAFVPWVFKQDYSINNRVKQLQFQRRLDFFVKKYYTESCAELKQIINYRKKCSYLTVTLLTIICLIWYML